MIKTLMARDDDGLRIGRCGEWLIRVRAFGSAFDLAPAENFDRWANSVAHADLDLPTTARMLGLAQGDLYLWAQGA